MPSSYIRRGDGTVWPDPDDPGEVSWRLRYGTPSKEDLLWAASVVSAYRELCQARSIPWLVEFRRELRELADKARRKAEEKS